MKKIIVLSIFTFTSLFAQNIDNKSFRNKISQFVQKIKSEINLESGFNFLVVTKDQILFQDEYGIRDVNRMEPVVRKTPFYIASSTKSFLAAAIMKLHERGDIDINKPISNYLPDFNYSSEANSDSITIKNLLTHTKVVDDFAIAVRTAYSGQYDDKLVLNMIKDGRYFGENFRYTNTGYLFAAIIIEKVTGKYWKQIIHDEILAPLQMQNTSCYVSDYSMDELAQPHEFTNGIGKQFPFVKTDTTMHPAGGMISTSDDMINWIRFNLTGKTPHDENLLSLNSFKELHSQHADVDKTFWEYHRTGYGLGWYISDYNGETLIHHFGGYIGFRAHVSFMPEYGIGIASMINDDGEGFFVPDLIADYAYNLFLGKENAEELAESELNKIVESAKKNREKKAENESTTKVEPDLDFASVAGKYSNSSIGDISVSIEENDLVFTMGNLSNKAVFSSEEDFSVDWFFVKLGGKFNFEDGKLISVTLKAGNSPLEFKKL